MTTIFGRFLCRNHAVLRTPLLDKDGNQMGSSLLSSFIFFGIFIFSSTLIQAQMTSTNETKPPYNSAPSYFLFPEFLETTLPNGLKVIFVEDRTQPLLTVSVVSRHGAEVEHVHGIANFTSALLSKGTTSRSAQQIASEIDFLGGRLGAYSGWDSSVVRLTILSKFARAGIELLSDVLLNPTFPEEEIERQRTQTLAVIEHNLSDAGYLAGSAFMKTLFKNHPYGHSLTGSLKSVAGITRADCEKFYRETFEPEESFIVVAGNISLNELTEILTNLLGNWQSSSHRSEPIPTPTAPKSRKVAIVEKNDAAQTSFAIGQLTVNYADADFVPMLFLNTLFGAYFGSRLNANLRERNGFTYGVHSYVEPRKSTGLLIVGTSVGKDATNAAAREILAEFRRISDQPITDNELELTKKFLLGSFALQTETPNQVSALLSQIELYNLPKNYYQEYFATIEKMTKEQLLAVQKRRFTPENLVISASGDAKFLTEALKEFGEVEIVNVKE